MACDVMRVRLYLRQIRVVAVVSGTPNELVVEVESMLGRVRCAACGFRCARVHDTRLCKIRDADRGSPRSSLRRPPTVQIRLAGPPAAPRPLPRRRPPRRLGRARPDPRPLQNRRTAPSSPTQSTPSSPGPRRSSPGTTPAGPPTDASRAPTTCCKSCAAPGTSSPTPTNFEVHGVFVTQSPQPVGHTENGVPSSLQAIRGRVAHVAT